MERKLAAMAGFFFPKSLYIRVANLGAEFSFSPTSLPDQGSLYLINPTLLRRSYTTGTIDVAPNQSFGCLPFGIRHNELHSFYI